MAAPMGGEPGSGRERSACWQAPQGQWELFWRGCFLGNIGAPPRANRVEPEPAQGSPCCSCPRRRAGLFFGRTGRALDTCPKMNYLRDSFFIGALKTMRKSHLAVVVPTIMGQ